MTPKKYRLRIGDEIVGWEKNTQVVPTKSWFGGCWSHCEWYYSRDGKSWSKDYIVHGDKDQFTGLCDKKGKEIYEGDILKAFDKNYEVKFITTGSKMFVDYGYPDKHNAPCDDWAEIIGNVFQNKDLLKEKP